MTFPLEALSAAVSAQACDLGAAGDDVAHPADRAKSWQTGRCGDDWMVNKHYHLTGLDDLGVIDELVALLVDDCAPAAAVVAQSPGNPS